MFIPTFCLDFSALRPAERLSFPQISGETRTGNGYYALIPARNTVSDAAFAGDYPAVYVRRTANNAYQRGHVADLQPQSISVKTGNEI